MHPCMHVWMGKQMWMWMGMNVDEKKTERDAHAHTPACTACKRQQPLTRSCIRFVCTHIVINLVVHPTAHIY